MDGKRYLIVTADDFGIGPATSQGILDLAEQGLLSCTVLIVNSPHAEQAVRAWRQAGAPMELGWHPCLTLDEPVLPAGRVPSLVGRDGRFWGLGQFLKRVCTGRINAAEVEAELRAQLDRFVALVGRLPVVVNSHQHVQLFQPVGDILLDLLGRRRPLPYVRRIREPWGMLWRVPGARLKRTVLSWLGRRDARQQAMYGFPGNDWLAGITDPRWVADPQFLVRWLSGVPGRVVELACHPGHWDDTLVGRDCTPEDGGTQRRVGEFRRLSETSFREVCERVGFVLTAPSEVRNLHGPRVAHAA
ncbi:MAG TPA: ChbG/HpnK family deacetylase [Gemmataceae bacterium]|nr:ChbG/HpnK family deacetylase [Gemmataceae bacterium]